LFVGCLGDVLGALKHVYSHGIRRPESGLFINVGLGVTLAPQIYDNWTTDAEFILDNRQLYQNQEPVGRFAYNPKTDELAIGPMNEQHAIMIHNQTSSAPDEFVRGVYTSGKVMLRWYSTNPYADSDEIKAESFEAWWETKEMLEQNGMPPGMPVEMGVSTGDIQEEVGRFYR
jgi:hypothetical protein